MLDGSVQEVSEKLYSVLFSFSSPKSSSPKGGEALDPVYVYSLEFPEREAHKYVPIVNNGIIVAITVFKVFEDGRDYQFAQAIGFSDQKTKYSKYPPLDINEAEQVLMEKGYFHYETDRELYEYNGYTPNYIFTIFGDHKETINYLVSAIDGRMENLKTAERLLDEKQRSVAPNMSINGRGYVFIEENDLHQVREAARLHWEKRVEKINTYIREGYLKLDRDMNVVFDKTDDYPEDK